MDLKDKNLESRMQALFAQAESEEVSPSPFSKTAVLARFDEAQRKKVHQRSPLFWWKLGTAAATSFAVVMVVLFFVYRPSETFIAQAERPMVVSVQLEPMEAKKVAHARIDLPSDVFFFSKSQQGVTDQRSITLTFKQFSESGKLPFAIRSSAEGVREVQVSFYDELYNLLSQKTVRIKFKGST